MKASDRHPLDELLGVDPRAFEDDDLTQVLTQRADSDADIDLEVSRAVTEIAPDSGQRGDRPTLLRESGAPAAGALSVAGLAEASPSPVGNFEMGDDGLIGTLVDGRYRVLNVLGTGGIGLVYLCQHELLQKPVAMKVLRPEYVSHQDLNERFLIEARAASSIKSQRIVETIDVGTLPNGAPYFVMDYVEGETLAAQLERDGVVDLPQTLEIARQVAEGLVAAHAAGVVHRDLKPENVFLAQRPDGALFAKLFDFGIAKVAGQRKRLTYVGAVFGTPTYMSPEQARGEAVDERADLYALGIMLFEMLAGTVPFDGEDPLAIMAQHVDRTPPLLSSACSIPVPPLLEAIVQRCLEKSPSARYPNAATLLVDLNRVDPNEPVALAPPAPPPPPPPPPFIGLPNTQRVHVVPAPAPPPTKKGKGALFRTAVAAALLGVGGGWAAYHGVLPIDGVASSTLGGESTAAQKLIEAARPSMAPNTHPAPDKEREVHFVLFPLDARVFRGEKDLGPMPVSLRLKKGETATVTVRRKGFSTRKVVVDGKESRLVVGLVKANEGSDARRHAASRPPTRTESSNKRAPTRATTPNPRASER